MKYELAKRLKDAGFPQDYSEGILNGNFAFKKDKMAYAPTLKELIMACGEKYNGYEFVLTYSIDGWFCNYFDDNFDGMSELKNGKGKTPEEAVANLWLALNEKK